MVSRRLKGEEDAKLERFPCHASNETRFKHVKRVLSQFLPAIDLDTSIRTIELKYTPRLYTYKTYYIVAKRKTRRNSGTCTKWVKMTRSE